MIPVSGDGLEAYTLMSPQGTMIGGGDFGDKKIESGAVYIAVRMIQ
jgi:hypothetical protein